jgi:hypothetical protein
MVVLGQSREKKLAKYFAKRSQDIDSHFLIPATQEVEVVRSEFETSLEKVSRRPSLSFSLSQSLSLSHFLSLSRVCVCVLLETEFNFPNNICWRDYVFSNVCFWLCSQESDVCNPYGLIFRSSVPWFTGLCGFCLVSIHCHIFKFFILFL